MRRWKEQRWGRRKRGEGGKGEEVEKAKVCTPSTLIPHHRWPSITLFAGKQAPRRLWRMPVLSSPPPNSCRTGQSPAGILRTLPNSATLGRTGTELGRISAQLKYFMENSKCHVTLSNNSLYTDNLILRIPQIFRFKEKKLNCIQWNYINLF